MFNFKLKKSIVGNPPIDNGSFVRLRHELMEKVGVNFKTSQDNQVMSDFELAFTRFLDCGAKSGYLLNKDCHILYDKLAHLDISDRNLHTYFYFINALSYAIKNHGDLIWE